MIITFEGLDGMGKGTQIKKLLEVLDEKGVNYISVVEPGGTEVGQEIRKILLHKENIKIDGLTEAILFSAARAQLVKEVIEPALKEEKIVITDRSYLTTLAYQGYGREYDIDTLNDLTDIAIGDFRPDIVFLLDGDPKVGIERKHTQKELNRLDQEKIDFYERARVGYLDLAKDDPEVFHVLDATESPEIIHMKIMAVLEEHI